MQGISQNNIDEFVKKLEYYRIALNIKKETLCSTFLNIPFSQYSVWEQKKESPSQEVLARLFYAFNDEDFRPTTAEGKEYLLSFYQEGLITLQKLKSMWDEKKRELGNNSNRSSQKEKNKQRARTLQNYWEKLNIGQREFLGIFKVSNQNFYSWKNSGTDIPPEVLAGIYFIFGDAIFFEEKDEFRAILNNMVIFPPDNLKSIKEAWNKLPVNEVETEDFITTDNFDLSKWLELVKQLIFQSNVTEEEFFQILDLSTQTLEIWEKEHSKPSDKTIAVFLYVFGEVIDFFLNDDTESVLDVFVELSSNPSEKLKDAKQTWLLLNSFKEINNKEEISEKAKQEKINDTVKKEHSDEFDFDGWFIKVAFLRRSSGLTVNDEFYAKLGLTNNVFYGWKNGRIPTPNCLSKFAFVFEEEVSDFVQDKDTQELLEEIRKDPPPVLYKSRQEWRKNKRFTKPDRIINNKAFFEKLESIAKAFEKSVLELLEFCQVDSNEKTIKQWENDEKFPSANCSAKLYFIFEDEAFAPQTIRGNKTLQKIKQNPNEQLITVKKEWNAFKQLIENKNAEENEKVSKKASVEVQTDKETEIVKESIQHSSAVVKPIKEKEQVKAKKQEETELHALAKTDDVNVFNKEKFLNDLKLLVDEFIADLKISKREIFRRLEISDWDFYSWFRSAPYKERSPREDQLAKLYFVFGKESFYPSTKEGKALLNEFIETQPEILVAMKDFFCNKGKEKKQEKLNVPKEKETEISPFISELEYVAELLHIEPDVILKEFGCSGKLSEQLLKGAKQPTEELRGYLYATFKIDEFHPLTGKGNLFKRKLQKSRPKSVKNLRIKWDLVKENYKHVSLRKVTEENSVKTEVPVKEIFTIKTEENTEKITEQKADTKKEDLNSKSRKQQRDATVQLFENIAVALELTPRKLCEKLGLSITTYGGWTRKDRVVLPSERIKAILFYVFEEDLFCPQTDTGKRKLKSLKENKPENLGVIKSLWASFRRKKTDKINEEVAPEEQKTAQKQESEDIGNEQNVVQINNLPEEQKSAPASKPIELTTHQLNQQKMDGTPSEASGMLSNVALQELLLKNFVGALITLPSEIKKDLDGIKELLLQKQQVAVIPEKENSKQTYNSILEVISDLNIYAFHNEDISREDLEKIRKNMQALTKWLKWLAGNVSKEKSRKNLMVLNDDIQSLFEALYLFAKVSDKQKELDLIWNMMERF